MISTSVDQEVRFLRQHGEYKKICLQFPDEYSTISADIASMMKEQLPELDFFVLLDTTYGSCCVDEVAAEHAHADLVIHYGETCMSRPSRLPVYYLFGKRYFNHHFDFEASLTKIAPNGEQVLILFDAEFQYLAEFLPFPENVQLCLIEQLFVSPQTAVNSNDRTLFLGRTLPCPKEEIPEAATFLYFGTNSNTLTCLNMHFSSFPIYHFEPTTGSCSMGHPLISRQMNRRFLATEKAKGADIIGILVGTLAVDQFREVIDKLREVITRAGKRAYTVLVGKLNPAKLANFAEIPVFVMVSCQLNSVIDGKEFYQTIITPFELEVALGLRTWDPSKYCTDFARLLDSDAFESDEREGDDDEPVFSLATGKYVTSRRLPTERDGVETRDLVQLGPAGSLILSGLEASRSSRTWNGLDLSESLKGVSLAKEGRAGIARGYAEEGRT